jgi:two-component system OmpR family sensor kinase
MRAGACWDRRLDLEPDEADRVFERFLRSPSARRTSGAGLGLTIARELAEAQGGSLDLETSPAGNPFVLRFPPTSRALDHPLG